MASTISAGLTSGTAIAIAGDTSGALVLQTNGTTTAVTISTAQVVTLAQPLPEGSGGTGTTTGYYGMKSRIINGSMVIDQRNAGALVSPAVNATYYLDRWYAGSGAAGKFSIQQTPSATETGYAVRVAAGFTSYLACTSLSAYTAGASEQFVIRQAIEGLNISDLAWGTASAKTITISALVYSSLTGTFGGSLYNNAGDRSYPFTYSIPVANTWTTISVTIAGDTTGTWLTTNSVGIYVGFAIGAGATVSGTAGAWSSTLYRSATGATSVVGTNGATFYITGVQLEKGSTATSFDYRPYGTELALCQRYYCNNLTGVGTASSTTVVALNLNFPVTMRATPTILVTTALTISDSGANYAQSSANSGTYAGNLQGGLLYGLLNFTGMTAFRVSYPNHGSTSPITASAEL